jgi:hypothetical protein
MKAKALWLNSRRRLEKKQNLWLGSWTEKFGRGTVDFTQIGYSKTRSKPIKLYMQPTSSASFYIWST